MIVRLLLMSLVILLSTKGATAYGRCDDYCSCPLPPSPNLVAFVQKQLAEKGLYHGETHGHLDAQTRAAIRSFRLQNNVSFSVDEISAAFLEALLGPEFPGLAEVDHRMVECGKRKVTFREQRQRNEPIIKLYETIMAHVRASPESNGMGSTYHQRPNPKALAACIDWSRSRPDSWNNGEGRKWQFAYSKPQEEAKTFALANCRGRARCEYSCVIVDVSGMNALTAPAEWVERHRR